MVRRSAGSAGKYTGESQTAWKTLYAGDEPLTMLGKSVGVLRKDRQGQR